MISNQIVYIVLNLIMYYCLFIAGKRIAKIKVMTWPSLWKAAWIGIVAFTLNEGLRFGRGIDYNLYADAFEGDPSEWDALFYSITKLLKLFDLPWQAFVLLMSFTLIVSIIFFVRHFKKVAPWALVAFSLLSHAETENLMRWYFAFSFILIGFSIYMECFDADGKTLDWIKKSTIFVLLSIIAINIHFGIFIIPICVFLFSLSKRPVLTPIISIILFFAIGMSFQTDMMLTFKDYMNVFALFNADKAEHYINNVEQWLTGGSSILIFRAFPPIYMTVLYIIGIWFGHKIAITLMSRKYTIVYNMFCIGFVLLPMANQIEIFTRYNELFLYMQFVVWGYICYNLKLKTCLFNSKFKYILTCSIILLFSMNTVRRWYSLPDYRTLYIWDAQGKTFLNLNTTYFQDMFRNQQRNNKNK